jgi:phage-related protein
MKKKQQKKVPAVFYRTSAGNEPVRDWILDLNDIDRKIIGSDIATVEYGWPIGMPTCRPMGDGLYEVRSDLSKNRTARVMFCMHEGSIVLLHAFIKKTRATSAEDLGLARKRKKDVES